MKSPRRPAMREDDDGADAHQPLPLSSRLRPTMVKMHHMAVKIAWNPSIDERKPMTYRGPSKYREAAEERGRDTEPRAPTAADVWRSAIR